MPRFLIGLLAALLTLAASGCGFRLQGGHNWPAQWQAYALQYSAREPATVSFAAQLDQALRQRGLRPEDPAAVRLVLSPIEDRKVVAAIGGDGKAVEFELRRTVRFHLEAQGWRSEQVALSSERRLSFDPRVALAKEVEEQQLLTSLSRELIELMLLRAESELQALARWQPPSAESDQGR